MESRRFDFYKRFDDQTLEQTKPRQQRYALAIVFFLLTVISTLLAGTALSGKIPWEIENWQHGITYSVLIMLFLASHEFGHYVAARLHKVDASLPYFLPMPLVFLSPFGTFGAFIRTRSPILSRKALFDIGAAGPLAGFVVCVAILIAGLITLPPIDFLYSVHPEYRALSAIPENGMRFGDTLLLPVLTRLFAPENAFMPPMNEIYHYPFLCVGWFGMFVTALNMLPFGQLDGGHILYAMFGNRQRKIASFVWWLIVIFGLGGALGELRLIVQNNSPDTFYTAIQSALSPFLESIYRIAPWYFNVWSGWLFWAFIGRFLVKLPHPPVEDYEPLNKGRMALGWVAIAAFVLSFSYNGIIMDLNIQEDAPQNPGVRVVENSIQN